VEVPRRLIYNRPLVVLVACGALGATGLPFLTHAPNRLVSGQSIGFWSQPTLSLVLALIPGCVLMVAGFAPQTHRRLRGVALAAITFLIALFFLAGTGASSLAATSSATARTSFGSGFWVLSVSAGLVLADTLARAASTRSTRFLAGAGISIPIAIMLGSGHLSDLSIMREYANKSDVFQQAVLRHMLIVAGALIPTLLLGVPLGVLAFRRPGFAGKLLGGLNVIQTIPSIALFGLLMAPLSALALAVPQLRAAGISGIGLAPAIIALTLYCLLPVVRNTLEGLANVPHDVVDAARGMGLTDRQILWQIQAPLALPVFLSGLHITIVQAIGLAAVAALIGAGGLGSIMFQGLFANALDLVLLGAVPIIMMVVVVDVVFKFGAAWLNRTMG
jgi:osmoprotectant transport system permease protein